MQKSPVHAFFLVWLFPLDCASGNGEANEAPVYASETTAGDPAVAEKTALESNVAGARPGGRRGGKARVEEEAGVELGRPAVFARSR